MSANRYRSGKKSSPLEFVLAIEVERDLTGEGYYVQSQVGKKYDRRLELTPAQLRAFLTKLADKVD